MQQFRFYQEAIKSTVFYLLLPGKGPWRVSTSIGQNCEDAKNVEVGIKKLEHTALPSCSKAD